MTALPNLADYRNLLDAQPNGARPKRGPSLNTSKNTLTPPNNTTWAINERASIFDSCAIPTQHQISRFSEVLASTPQRCGCATRTSYSARCLPM